MMELLTYADKQGSDFCVSWVEGGMSFVITNPDQFVRQVVPKFFGGATKFASFTRKLYRWGFRQVNRGVGPDDPIIFNNEYFQRDLPDLAKNMKSITAAATRRAEQKNVFSGNKHARAEDSTQDISQKRMMLDLLGQQHNANFCDTNRVGSYGMMNSLGGGVSDNIAMRQHMNEYLPNTMFKGNDATASGNHMAQQNLIGMMNQQNPDLSFNHNMPMNMNAMSNNNGNGMMQHQYNSMLDPNPISAPQPQAQTSMNNNNNNPSDMMMLFRMMQNADDSQQMQLQQLLSLMGQQQTNS
jgi:hypothetical protein